MPRISLILLQLMLVAGILFLGASVAHKLMTLDDAGPKIQAGENALAPAEESGRPSNSQDIYRAIAQRNLFQTPKQGGSKAPLNIETLKPTELKLKLWGTITGEDGLTRAVIEDQTTKEQALFRSGDEVASARIKMILREKVVLSVDGEDEILEIEEPTGRGGPGIMARTGPDRPNVAEPAAAEPATLRTPGSRSIRLKLSRLGPISDDANDWAKGATAAPFSNDEGESGLVINRVAPSSPLRRLGIRSGDVVLNINGQPVEELSDIFETLLDTSEGDTLSLNIKRRGRERQIDFQFE